MRKSRFVLYLLLAAPGITWGATPRKGQSPNKTRSVKGASPRTSSTPPRRSVGAAGNRQRLVARAQGKYGPAMAKIVKSRLGRIEKHAKTWAEKALAVGEAAEAEPVDLEVVGTPLEITDGLSRLERVAVEESFLAAIDFHLEDAISDTGDEHRSAKLRQQLEEGAEANEVFIVTHQDGEGGAGAKTARLLSKPRFRQVPRLMLVSHWFPIASKKLLAEATKIRFSEDGKHQSKINTKTIHLAGGDCFQCLTDTLRNAIGSSVENRKEITVILHTALIYGGGTENLGETLESMSGQERVNELKRVGKNMLGNKFIYEESERFVELAEQGNLARNREHHGIVVYERPADQKRVRLVFARE